MKTGIVCEGGGMRGVYTVGVLEAFLQAGFVADELIGVSAGASNGVTYVAGQKGRGYRVNVEYAGDKRYISVGNYLRTGSLFGMDFIFGEIPEKLDVFDYEAFQASPCQYYAGVTNVNTGKAEYFGKEDIGPGLAVLRASCSIPTMAPIVEYNGQPYLDGGVAAPIPIQKALDDGCEKLVVVLTRPRGYVKKAQSGRVIYKRMYKEYPNLVRAMDLRHMVYNHTLRQLARLEEEGRAIIVAPRQPLEADRMGKNKEKLIHSYQEGIACGEEALKLL